MKKRILWMGLSFLVVAALVLASCGPAVEEVEEEEEEEEEEEVEEAVEEEVEEEVVEEEEGVPQYGGTLVVFNNQQGTAAVDPPSADIKTGQWLATQWLGGIQESPIMGDFEKYGPRGTGEYGFATRAIIPELVSRGALLESWEVHTDRLVWHVRPGVMWHDNPYLGFDFEPRELTAEDIIADLEYFRTPPAPGVGRLGPARLDIGEIYATDRYTIVLEWGGFDATWFVLIGYEDRSVVGPPEMEVGDRMGRWDSQVGTGPWMLKEYVVGTSMNLVRNPNYWDTTTIDGVEYEIPFIDGLTMPIIPDAATQIAAFTTGKIDFYYIVDQIHWDSVESRAPEILSNKFSEGGGQTLNFNVTEPPFDNLQVRRALSIGTDRRTFAALEDAQDLPARIPGISPAWVDAYTPLAELPASSQELYDYDPDKAIQMLADAGYPDGLETDVILGVDPMGLDRASLLQYQWAQIGVDVEIRAMDTVSYRELIFNMEDKAFGVALHRSGGGTELYHSIRGPTTLYYTNFTGYSNPVYDAMVELAAAQTDSVERNRLCKEANEYRVAEAISIGLNESPSGHHWWPWIKNYYGERNTGDNVITTVLAYAWFDQDMKADMGY